MFMGKSAGATYLGENTCCSMKGVVCSGSKVTQIYWENQQLTGQIASDIGNLKDLQEL
jgi:hypothetical protein